MANRESSGFLMLSPRFAASSAGVVELMRHTRRQESQAGTMPYMFTKTITRICRILHSLIISIGLSGCGEVSIKDGFGNTLTYGNIHVIADDGRDITKFCENRVTNIDDKSRINEDSQNPNRYSYQFKNYSVIERLTSDGFYIKKADIPDSVISPIHCEQTIANSFSKDSVLVTSIESLAKILVPQNGIAVYFGDLVINLKADKSLSVTKAGYSHSDENHGGLHIVQASPEATRVDLKWSQTVQIRTHMYVP